MKKLISLILLLSLLLAGCGSPAENEETVPTGDYLLIPVNPDTLYCDLPGYWNLPNGAYLVRLKDDGEPTVVVIAKGDSNTDTSHVMNTSDGSQVVFYKENGRYSFEKTMTKTKSCYSDSDELLWEMTITATFRYDGTSAECTEVSGEVYIAATGSWYVISENPETNGNTGSYTVELGRSALGVTTSTASYTITVSCDKEGNIN